ncbi:MAG: YdeI/OmpD-associated family protein [Armatimonadota bacterium]
MEITETLYVNHRQEWRAWLTENHKKAAEIWLVYPRKLSGKARLAYDDAVEEALCFGWIDGIQKSLDAENSAQRFTPRRARSNWSEVNKERARRMIEQGQMTEAGTATLCDLSTDSFAVADDIRDALQASEGAWANFQGFPDFYQRIRVAAIEEVRDRPDVFDKRLARFVAMTAKNQRFGMLK